MTNPISAFMICKNEEQNIGKALQSLHWADEIVVVDGKSTDHTVEIVNQYTSKIFHRDWTNFGEQRNFALSKTRFPWVFFLDADEICSPELIEWFQKFKTAGLEACAPSLTASPSIHPLPGGPRTDRVDMIEIRRLEHFRGMRYRFGAGNPSHQWRFFRREGAHFTGEVHEYPVFEGRILRLERPIYHFPKATLEQLMRKANLYSTLEADQLFKKGIHHGVTYMFFSGFSMFLKSYFRKQGFRDGFLGFILAVFDGTAFFLRQAKLYLRHRGL